MDYAYEINGFKLKELCGACPEDYDVYKGYVHVGYFRLRWGTFGVWDADYNELIWKTTKCKGDGIFEYDEREKFLTLGTEMLQEWLDKKQKEADDVEEKEDDD